MAYTQDQYLGFAQQLAPYLSDPTQLMQQAGKLGLGVEDVAKAAQTFNPNITASQIQGYFQPAGISYQPTDQQYAQELAPYLGSPLDLVRQAESRGLDVQDVGRIAQAYNPDITTEQIQSYFQPAGITYQPSGALPGDAAQQTGALSTLTPTADVSLTPSGAGNVAPIGSLAYQRFTAPGGAGLTEMNRIISEYIGTSPTEADVYRRMKEFGVSKEDIERATGKTLDMLYPELFRPGSVLSSGFGDVTKQLGGSGYYKGVAIPAFREYVGDENNPPQTVADQLARWKANIDKQDLSATAPFGFVETPIYSPGSGDSDAYISGYQAAPATALDYLTKNNPVISSAIYGHTSTDARAYKVVNGQLQEVGQDQITPEDIAQGNAFFMLAGKTGGPDRERMSQLYRAEGDNLIPVGDPKMYKGAKEQDMGLMFLDMAASALSFVPGPWQVPAMVYKAARAADQGDWSGVAKIFLPGPIATAVNIYEAIDSKNPWRIANSLMQSDLLPGMGNQKIPGTDFTVNDGIKAARIVNAVSGDQKDLATALQLAGELSNSPNAALAGKGLKVVQAFESGNMNAMFNAAMDLSKTADKLTNVKVPATNADAAAKAFVDAKNAGASDEDAAAAAADFSGDSFIKGLDPRITGQGIPDDPFADPRAFEGQGGDLIEAGYIAPPKIPGLSLGQQEQLVGSAMYAPLRDIDEEGNETTYSGLRQQIQMMDANGQPVLDAAGKPIIYEALYDPKDGSIRYSVKVGDDDTRLAQGSNLLSQKPQIGFDDEGNRVLFNPVNNRVIAVLEATSDAPVSGTKLDDLAATDSQLDDITFAALEGLRQGAEAGDGELSVEGGETVDLLDPTKKPGEGLSDLDTIVLDGKQPGDTAEKPGGDTGGKPGDKDGKPGGANDGLGTDTLPGAGADTLPGEGADTLPGSGADTLPGEGADTLPGEGADTLPGEGADTLPGEGADTLPGDGADTLPGDGADTLPGAGADTLPGDGADTVPGSVIKDDEEPPPKFEVEPEPPEVTCPEGYHLGPDGKTCVPDEKKEEITCPEGYHLGPDGKTCVPDEKKEEPPKPPVVTSPPVVTKPPVTTTPKGALPASQQAGPLTGPEIARLQGKMLESKVLQERQIDPLAAMKQRIEEMNSIDPMLAAVLSQRLGLPQPKPETPSYTYGQETSIDDILGLNSREYAEGGFVEPLKAAGGAMNPQFMYRAGGLGTREDFRHGKHVAGEGDGQSDDIPAWLADGEFVFPADVVSALGNGSTKAGTDKLYKMMHEIRARARSTKEKDLPPPAHKSPLDYLKKGK